MSPPTDLDSQLRELKESYSKRADPARTAVMEAATQELRASGIETTAANIGDLAFDMTLADATGKPVTLSDLWKKGPLVMVFYRGGWCPYCNLALRAWQARLDTLAVKGASLVAISPQTPDASLTTAEKNALAFPVLSDPLLLAAHAYGIAFTMPPELQALYKAGGNDLAVMNGNGLWQLPIPATFIVDQNGVVIFSDVDADYRARAEPSEVIEAIPMKVARAA